MIFSCGEALVDLVPDPVPGGGPMNVAVAAARLGVSTAFVGGVSTDDHGETLWGHLSANGVDLSLSRRYTAPTARAIVEHVPELRFRFDGDDTADTLLEEVAQDRVAGNTNIVHGGTLGMFRGVTAETLATVAEQHDGMVSLDPNVRPQIIDDPAAWHHFHERWLTNVDFYKGSEEDVAWIWPDRSPEDSASGLLARGVAAVMITRGGDGLSVFTVDGEVEVPAPRIDVVDTVGAGDTVVGATLASIAEHFGSDPIALGDVSMSDWRRFAARAADAAAVTCSREGADPPFRRELRW